ncbi:hypothetical protein [Streptoalloteichus hindustanus]|uniref:Adhesin n=1 Tax=Streptoalloteichus hindustanus TaxID=2017 RepID=A0A1M4XU56_STRHI|nr:hypothetical protein [Streptoalloteichus hindustanus]SHE96772.1 hypothetical protein SAMN05444320_102117 [Streptoalloteichus hindustanus]
MASRRKAVGVAVALTAVAVAGLTGCDSKESRADNRSFDFAGPKLTIDVREAGLRIESGPAGKVAVDRVLSGKATAEGAAQLSMSGTTLTMAVECRGLVTSCGAQHTVRVPQGVAVEIRGSGSSVTAVGLTGSISAELHNDGSLQVEDPTGELNLNSGGGGIIVHRARSSVVTAKASADANVDISFAAPPTRVEVQAGGYANVTLPASRETYRIDPPTAAGAGIANNPASQRVVAVRAGEGRASVKLAG